MLKPQDILVIVKVALLKHGDWSVRDLAEQLSMSPTEVHNSSKRLVACDLMNDYKRAKADNLIEFLEHGIRYVFPAAPSNSPLVKGVPTASSASPISDDTADPNIYVWKSGSGSVNGCAIEPLYKSVVAACHRDSRLYQCMALVDCFRMNSHTTIAKIYIRKFLI